MSSKFVLRFKPIGRSLRARVALGIALPVFLTLTILSLTQYMRERNLLEDQIQLAAQHIGEVALGGLQHAMLDNDTQHLEQVLKDVSGMENIQRVQIISLTKTVAVDSAEEDLGRMRQYREAGCRECHEAQPASIPRTALLAAVEDTLRISTPIDNDPECRTCHAVESGHLGVLLLDVSLVDSRTHLIADLRKNLIVAGISTLIITVGVFLLIHRLVVRRVERFRQPLDALAHGEFDTRIPLPTSPRDELDELAIAFNHMAQELQRHTHEQETRRELRWQAIVEERERIAREMHDGIAQWMGYVNTKAAAIRLLLESKMLDQAKDQLQQLSNAAGEAFTEMRASILGLRTSSLRNGGLQSTLKEFTTKFSELSGIQVELTLPEDNLRCDLSPESELHLLRITQEALNNIRKHANSSQAWIHLSCQDRTLQLIIGDDGDGFDPSRPPADQRPHFGLATMRERADAMGASFEIDSEPGGGTRVSVRLPYGA